MTNTPDTIRTETLSRFAARMVMAMCMCPYIPGVGGETGT